MLRLACSRSGEITPFAELALCQLHNQTMTVTTFHEED